VIDFFTKNKLLLQLLQRCETIIGHVFKCSASSANDILSSTSKQCQTSETAMPRLQRRTPYFMNPLQQGFPTFLWPCTPLAFRQMSTYPFRISKDKHVPRPVTRI